MFKTKVYPLSENMVNSIDSSINRMMYNHNRPADRKGGENKIKRSPTPDTSLLGNKEGDKMIFYDNKEANDYMKNNPGWIIDKIMNDKIYLVRSRTMRENNSSFFKESWEPIDNMTKVKSYVRLMKMPIPAGKAQHKMRGIIHDPVLFDEFDNLAKQFGESYDVRGVIQMWIKKSVAMSHSWTNPPDNDIKDAYAKYFEIPRNLFQSNLAYKYPKNVMETKYVNMKDDDDSDDDDSDDDDSDDDDSDMDNDSDSDDSDRHSKKRHNAIAKAMKKDQRKKGY